MDQTISPSTTGSSGKTTPHDTHESPSGTTSVRSDTTPSRHRDPSSPTPPPIAQEVNRADPKADSTPHAKTPGGGRVLNHNGSIAGDTDAVSVLTPDDARSRGDDTLSGYSGQREDGGTMYQHYYNRLTKFYLRYNPEKLDRVEEFLKAYRGDEEQLFQLLQQKYGPEPDPPRSVCSASDFGIAANVNSNSALRTQVPMTVPPEVGHTAEATPYWPGKKTVSDRDLCEALEAGQVPSTNPDLASVFKGHLREHPTMATNGLTYLSAALVPADGSRFLGHLWSGSLANNKVLVHRGVQYHRTVLHCSETCSSATTASPQSPSSATPAAAAADAPHERWRLTMYRAEHTPNVLFRVVWDPVIHMASSTFPDEAPTSASRRFGIQYATRRRPGSDAGSTGTPTRPPPRDAQYGVSLFMAAPLGASAQHFQALAAAQGGSVSSEDQQQPQQPIACRQVVPQQPTAAAADRGGPHQAAVPSSLPLGSGVPQPPAQTVPGAGGQVGSMAAAPGVVGGGAAELGPMVQLILVSMQQMEARLDSRLHSMEERLMNIETALLDPEQPLQ